MQGPPCTGSERFAAQDAEREPDRQHQRQARSQRGRQRNPLDDTREPLRDARQVKRQGEQPDPIVGHHPLHQRGRAPKPRTVNSSRVGPGAAAPPQEEPHQRRAQARTNPAATARGTSLFHCNHARPRLRARPRTTSPAGRAATYGFAATRPTPSGSGPAGTAPPSRAPRRPRRAPGDRAGADSHSVAPTPSAPSTSQSTIPP